MGKGVFCAVDTQTVAKAKEVVTLLSPVMDCFKLGLEFFIANGPEGILDVRSCAPKETKFFLDLKLHDIPNTVAGAVRAASACHVDFLTIHTSGGPEMIKAALQAAKEEEETSGWDAPLILGVTVLTSLDESVLESVGQETPVSDQVVRLAKMGYEAGLRGFVCSPHEIKVLRLALGSDAILVVPGIRPTAGGDDQKRTMTPEQALAAGADYLVVGRPITQAPDPVKAAKDIVAVLGTV